MVSSAVRAAAAIAAVAVGVVGAARAVARHFEFPVHEVPILSCPDDVLHRDCFAADGVPVHALEITAPAGARTIVYFHNNRETVEERVAFARGLRARGFGVLLVEYRGYGRAPDTTPSEQGLYADAEAALDMLEGRGVGADHVVLWGTSLGTGVAAEMARRGRGTRLVLVSPYTSIPALVTDVAPLVPARFFIADPFDTLAKADAIRVPTLVIHGDADEIVPYWMGKTVAAAIVGARLVTITGGHHGDLFARERDRLLDEIAALGS